MPFDQGALIHRDSGAGPRRLGILLATLPPYPHAELNFTNVPKQSTRMIKIVCVECEAIFRCTRKVLDEVGLPTCACGGDIEEAE